MPSTLSSAPSHALSPRVVDRVHERELARLAGLPHDATLERFRPALREARAWYREHGRPLLAARPATVGLHDPDRVCVLPGGVDPGARVDWRSRSLLLRLRRGGAASVLVVGASAGPEVEEEAARSWRERPDRAWLLERLAAAVAERLALDVARDPRLLPPLSPGYVGWAMEEQGRVFEVLCGNGQGLRGALRLTDGGMLFPKNSLLSVLGIRAAPRAPAPEPDGSSPCAGCGLEPCAFRRHG